MKNLYNVDDKTLLYIDSVTWQVQLEKEKYIAYKTRTVYDKISDEQKLEMEVLSLLEQLGFPMEQIGTYLYKNMIVKVVNQLDSMNNNFDNCKKFISQLEEPFSQFYIDVARNDLDMGVKSFHEYVSKAVESIDYSKADPSLWLKLCSNNYEKTDYKKQAFVIGSYVPEFLEEKKIEVAFVKQIASVTARIKI